jgi:hypothetical protein
MIGDLVEQRQRGRSSAWYWRQTMSAIATSFVAEMWQHKLLAISGGVTPELDGTSGTHLPMRVRDTTFAPGLR